MTSAPETTTCPTKEKLLLAACEVFAEKGYRDATIADICQRAGANIAAANYHYGDKERLYTAAWRHSFEVATTAIPSHGMLPDDAPAEERLRVFIDAKIRQIFATGEVGHLARVVFSELGAPTAAIGQIFHEVIAPERQRLEGIIADLLGDAATPPTVCLCTLSVMSQCMAHAHFRFGASHRPLPPEAPTLSPELLAQHIGAFSLAGIDAVRRAHGVS